MTPDLAETCPYLGSVAGASGFAFLFKLVAHTVSEFLHFIGDGSTGLFAAGRRQQHYNSNSYSNPDQQGGRQRVREQAAGIQPRGVLAVREDPGRADSDGRGRHDGAQSVA